MEPLWSHVVANSGNQSQIGRARSRRKQADTVAVGCNQLRPGLDGKEGVSRSESGRGLPETPAKWGLALPSWQTSVTRGHSRALSEVPSRWACRRTEFGLFKRIGTATDPLCTAKHHRSRQEAGTVPDRRVADPSPRRSQTSSCPRLPNRTIAWARLRSVTRGLPTHYDFRVGALAMSTLGLPRGR